MSCRRRSSKREREYFSTRRRVNVERNNRGLFRETQGWPILDPRRLTMSEPLMTIVEWIIIIIVIVAGLWNRDDKR